MRTAPPRTQPAQRVTPQAWMRLLTPIGWIGIGWTEDGLAAIRMGYQTESDLIRITGQEKASEIPMWVQRLADRLQAYCSGRADDFRDIPLAPLWSTEFQQAVVTALRAVPYGETVSYQDLAAKAGRPRAARAVGHVMSTNPVALVVPCHRVLASGGKIGGFSAPTGLDLKRQLLEMEAAHDAAIKEIAPKSGRRPVTANKGK